MEVVDLEVPLVEVADILSNGVKFYTVKKVSGSGADTILSLVGISGVPLEERLVSMLDHGYSVRSKGAPSASPMAPESPPAVEPQTPTEIAAPLAETVEAALPERHSSDETANQPSPAISRKSIQEVINDLKREEEENIERIRKKTAEKIFKAAQKAQSPSEKRKEALEKMDLMREKIRVIHPFMLDADVDQKIMLAIDSYVSSISDRFSKEGAKEGASESVMRTE